MPSGILRSLKNIKISNKIASERVSIQYKAYLGPYQTSTMKTSWRKYKSSHQWYCIKKDVLKNFPNFTENHLFWSLFLIKLQVFSPAIFYKKMTPIQAFSRKICEEHLRMTASGNS